MTHKEIETMEAGPEMDLLIDEHIQPLKRNGSFDGYPAYDNPKDGNLLIVGRPNYSTDIAAAWFVIEKMRTYIPEYGDDSEEANRNAEIWDRFIEQMGFESMHELMADINPLVICRAALLAIPRVTK